MLILVHSFAPLHALVFAAAKKTSSDSSTFLFILVILAVGAFLFIRPQRRRQRAQQEMQKAVAPGDEVVTTAGIVGRVQSMNDERVRLEVAPGTTIEVVRRAIGQRVSQGSWQTEPGDANSQWDVPASGSTDGTDGQHTDTSSGEESGDKWGFPSPSPKPEPDEGSSTGGSTEGSA